MRRAATRLLTRRPRGNTLITTMLMLVVLSGFVSLGVDVGRVRVVKKELQNAADASARYAVAAIRTNSSATVKANAQAAATENKAGGLPAPFDSALDCRIGTWNSTTSVFTPSANLADLTTSNAVEITLRRTTARGNPVPLVFGSLIGKGSVDVTVTSIAMINGSAARVSGKANVWLAGMPTGNYGAAGAVPANAPVFWGRVTPGNVLTFSVTGSTSDEPANESKAWDPDGRPPAGATWSWAGNRTNDSGVLNGMANLNTQQCSMIGVFLSDAQPNLSAAPAARDMSTPASLEFDQLAPLLKQPFFIGDGRKNSTGAVQTFVVPAGATRLFLATHDNVAWDINNGYFQTDGGTTLARVQVVR